MKSNLHVMIDTDVYLGLKNMSGDREVSKIVNALLEQFLSIREQPDMEEDALIELIEKKTKELEILTGEITSLKIKRADIIRRRAIEEKENAIKRKAFAQSMLNAGFVRDLRG